MAGLDDSNQSSSELQNFNPGVKKLLNKAVGGYASLNNFESIFDLRSLFTKLLTLRLIRKIGKPLHHWFDWLIPANL